jgi:membrane protein required for colicin V production
MKYAEGYNLIDLVIIALLLMGLILGTWKGFLRTLTALASLVVGVVAAFKYYTKVEPYLTKISALDPHISMILSMVIIFIAVQALFVVVRFILDALIDLTHLSWLDRIFGAAMGLAAGFLVAATGVEVVLAGVPEWPMVKESKLAPAVHEAATKGYERSPQSVKDQLQALLSKWQGTTESSSLKGPAKGEPPKGPGPKSGPVAPPAAAR